MNSKQMDIWTAILAGVLLALLLCLPAGAQVYTVQVQWQTYHDTNGNLSRDDGEPEVPFARVTCGAGDERVYAMTDGNGNATFYVPWSRFACWSTKTIPGWRYSSPAIAHSLPDGVTGMYWQDPMRKNSYLGVYIPGVHNR